MVATILPEESWSHAVSVGVKAAISPRHPMLVDVCEEEACGSLESKDKKVSVFTEIFRLSGDFPGLPAMTPV
jgi:hypothetical protein